MLRSLNTRLIGVLLLTLAVAGCDDEPGTPTTPTPTPAVTETFTGQVTQNGASTHSFTVSASGAVSATLRAVGTDNTLVVGLSLGNWVSSSSSCSAVLANDAATAGAVLSGTITGAGTLCVRVYDVGKISGGAAPYTVEVVHP